MPEHDHPPRGADGAEDADRFEPALHLRRGGCGEHHARGGESDRREGDEQRDHDPRRLADLDVDAAARQELERAKAEARLARLRERDVES